MVRETALGAIAIVTPVLWQVRRQKPRGMSCRVGASDEWEANR